MTALADEIRELSGTSEAIGLDAMKTHVGEANDEVASQANLIAQIATALEGKAAGGEVVEITLQSKTITPTTLKQTVTADSDYDGLDTVTINAIPSQYITTTDATASASDILSGKTAYVNGAKITGNIVTKTASNLSASGATVTVPAGYYASQTTKSVATATQATPSITIDANGKITASATQTAGYVAAGTKSATKQLTTQAAKTITPSTSSQTAVAKDVYTTGVVTVGAIPSQYITTTDATASADEIMSGETAYVNGSKVTGTFSIDNELNTQDSLIAQIQTALEGKASGSGSAEPVLQDKTVTPTTSKQTVKADNGYDGLGTVTVNAMSTATQATPSISVNSSGLITASATQTAGYVSAGTKSGTKQLTVQAAKTITPTTSNQTAVASGRYTTGAITVKGDANLVAANIAQGKTIFGVAGTHAGIESVEQETWTITLMNGSTVTKAVYLV
jgi:hypothetical protein